jgi:hypothetical protein
MKMPGSDQILRVRVLTPLLIFLLGLMVITPLCGLLFQCRCDWPWLSFYFECNYFHTEMTHKCPWCYSNLAGFGSIGAAFVFATVGALFILTETFTAKAATLVARVTFGLIIFILTAVLTGATAAYSQQYPLGIGSLFIEAKQGHPQ